ncbi:unnamed protein product [Rhizoctonia solani]|uniref:Protein kinase domain-containing protein n=1 Tax=Rhizoctonia solani TaxID=456999 RepID=A0A8H3B388_9AGAM|nr:unnamed protein product [Rhizoctonia solani]
MELAVFNKPSITQAATRTGILDTPGAPPSSQTSNFAKRQKKPETAIYNGRPWARTEKPIEIYHPAFRIFLDKIDEESSVSALDYARTENLLRASQHIYPDEESRRIALVDSLVILLGCDINKLAIPGCTADGVIKMRDTGNALEAFITVLEFKNEIGSSLGDPTVQGAASYGKYWCQDNLTPITNVSCCPAFIISVAGPWVCIFGAISLSQIIVQPLTEMLWVADPQKESRMKYLTRVFLALRNAISHLHEYYRTLLRSIVPPYVADPARFFPDIHCFQGRDGNETKFSYTDEFTRLVFKARTEENRDIVVKFVERYNAEAHELLARQGLAPELLFDGGDVLYGCYRMVVMEFCYGMTYLEYDRRRPDGMSQAGSELLSIRQTIKGALKLLHEANFVFGDLRKPNILIVEDEKGTIGAKLIDFDWCGPVGEGRYPANISDSIEWAPGMERGGLMAQKHDNDMLELLFS